MKRRIESVSCRTVRKQFPETARKGKRLQKNYEELKELQGNMKGNNIHIVETSEGEEEEQGIKTLFE